MALTVSLEFTGNAMKSNKLSSALLGVGRSEVNIAMTGLNVTVPKYFLGAHFSRVVWDSSMTIPSGANAGNPYPALPNASWGNSWARSLDNCPNWRQLHTASNTFSSSYLAMLDEWVNYHYTLGIKLIYVIYGTPQWAASTATNHTDQYGQLYGANPPSDLTSAGSTFLAQFVTMLVTRYNTGGVKKIAALEIWNEPHFDATASSYFTGTPSQLGQMAKTVWQAAKTIDPEITIVSPGIVGNFMAAYLSGVIGDGTTSANWQDAMAYHHYDFGINAGIEQSDFIKNDLVDLLLNGYKRDMDNAGIPNMPLWNTESGWISYGAWSGFTDVKRSRLIKCAGLIQAAAGVRLCTYYLADGGYFKSDGTVNSFYESNSNNSGNLFGGPYTNITIQSALQWVANLGGKTINEIGYSSGGGMYAKTTTGTIFTG